MTAQSSPILYSFRRCPYAMRARLALAASGTCCEVREVKLADKPKAMLDASPKGTVPVLVLPGGEVIDQSLDIMRWALTRADPEGWLERDDPALIAACDGPFKQALDGYKYPQRHGTDPLTCRTAGLAFLKMFEARLSQDDQLCGARPGLTDSAIVPFVRQFAAVDREWFAAQPLARVATWLHDHLGSPRFGTVMERLAPWTPGDAPVFLDADLLRPLAATAPA